MIGKTWTLFSSNVNTVIRKYSSRSTKHERYWAGMQSLLSRKDTITWYHKLVISWRNQSDKQVGRITWLPAQDERSARKPGGQNCDRRCEVQSSDVNFDLPTFQYPKSTIRKKTQMPLRNARIINGKCRPWWFYHKIRLFWLSNKQIFLNTQFIYQKYDIRSNSRS